MDQMRIETFKPEVFIEIYDAYAGIRKLAQVIGDGSFYVDLDGAEASPFPIVAMLEPEEAGNILGWGLYLVDHHPSEQPLFKGLVDQLLASDLGTLERNRAAHWAFLNHNYDYGAAVRAAQEQTQAIRTGRRRLDQQLVSSGVLQGTIE